MNMFRRSFLIAVLCALLSAPAAPAASKKRAAPAPDRLKEQIEAVLARPEAARAFWGIEVVSLDSGKTLYAQNEHKLFMPASNTKLFTAALALTTLGPKFSFRTTVESAAPADRYGRIAGDLWLVGRGDPTLSDRLLPYKGRPEREGTPLQVLDSLADQLVREGVRYVDGDLVADDSYFVFERYGHGWAQDDLVWAYGAPVSALTINDNVLSLEVLPGQKAGDRALLRLEPFQDYYRVENRVTTVEAPSAGAPGGGAADSPRLRRITVDRQPGSFTLQVWGAIPQGDSGVREQVAIEDPALFAGRYLRDALLQRGVTFLGQVRVEHAFPWQVDDLRRAAAEETRPAAVPATGQLAESPLPRTAASSTRVVLATRQSAPLAEELVLMAKISQNLHAEILLRTVARERRGIGSVAAGLEELKGLLAGAGVPPEECAFYDGSGLSRQNLVSTAAVVALLQYMDKQPGSDVWHAMLPVAGVDGSLNARFRDTPAVGRIQAKTGTLAHVSALSGYTTTAKGERVAFSIFVNNHNLNTRSAEALIDRIALAIAAQ